MNGLLVFLFFVSACVGVSRKLPRDLSIGSATSAYQVEGAWNEDGKGESMWDRIVHEKPEKITGRATGDVACDSYHKYKVDVQLLKTLGFQHYRFSLSWPRILPNGYANYVNPAGIKYYNDLIDELLANRIVPMVTLYHWDLPQVFQDLGGWTNDKIVGWFTDFADVAFGHFGDRIKIWTTINEPKQVCFYGYEEAFLAPALEARGHGEYMCARNVLMAHASAYHLYRKVYKKKQKGIVAMTIECPWYESGTDNFVDKEAAERRRQFYFGLYANPIYTKKGDYPQVVKTYVAHRSKAENYSETRMSPLSREEVSFIRGTYDYFGLNYYTTYYVKDKACDVIGTPSSTKDQCIEEYQNTNWPTGSFSLFKSVPWGFRKILKYIKVSYGNPNVLITENGFPINDEYNDTARLDYFTTHLDSMLDAIELDKVRVKAYTAWTLMDNFEWFHGYSVRFGITYVDFNSTDKARKPKMSAGLFKTMLETRTLTYTKK